MNPKEISDSVVRILHLETYPVAVKMYADRKECSRHPLAQKHNFCQLVNLARTAQRENASVADNMICAFGASCIGLMRTPEVITSGKAAVGAYVDDPEVAKKFMGNVYRIGDTGKAYDAVRVKPLGEIKEGEEPDAVIMYVNPVQAMRLIHAYTYDTGEKITADTVAEGAMCSSVGFAVKEGKATVGFPCAGDRIFGGTQNHELVFAAPYNWVKEKMIHNLEATAKGGFSVVPIPPNMHWTPSMPSGYTVQESDLSR